MARPRRWLSRNPPLRAPEAAVRAAMKLRARGHVFSFPRTPLLMGIVNLGADSFSGDGLPNPADAVVRAEKLVRDGADIVDVGAESARTNRPPISESEEVDRFGRFF